MPIKFDKAFDLMSSKGLSTYKIRKDKIITESTLQKMRENRHITTQSIENLCKACFPRRCGGDPSQEKEIRKYLMFSPQVRG